MIRKYETRRILQNGVGTSGKINGEILKIVIDNQFILEDVSFQIYTDCGEVIHVSEGIKGTEYYYPKLENGDLFCNFTQLKFEIRGLNEGETIDNIIIFYKGD